MLATGPRHQSFIFSYRGLASMDLMHVNPPDMVERVVREERSSRSASYAFENVEVSRNGRTGPSPGFSLGANLFRPAKLVADKIEPAFCGPAHREISAIARSASLFLDPPILDGPLKARVR